MSDSGNQLNQSLDNINSLLAITNEQEMSQKISQNIPILFQIFNSFKTKLNYGQIITPNDISKVIEALKFVDNLNLFIEENEVRKFKDKMMEIRDLLRKRNFDFKESILKQITYTEMTIISHKKLYFRDLYFNNHEGLSDEIKNELDQVYKGNKFDFKLFKQMQNIFWVVKNVIDENKKIELDNRLKNMKNESQKIKEKKFGGSSYLGRGYQSNYINDYKNYSGYDYNDNFIRNDDNNSYYNKNYINRNYHYGGRGGYINNSNRKYYTKKQEEKEIEIPSDPSYYYKGKESDLKLDEISENNVNNIHVHNNNYNSQENNDNINNINGGNDLLENNNNNEINLNGANGDEININQNNINVDLTQNNGGNGELNNINNENINSNEINQNKDIEIITGNQISPTYNRNYLNKMIAVELPISNEEIKENNINEENNNNGAKISETNNINNENNNIDNHYINNNYNYNGENNIEYRQYNNDYRDNKYKNYKYNTGYKSNTYNKNGYRNNNYNRYNMRNNISGNNYGENNNKRLLFVEIDSNNNPIQNKPENNEIINGQENKEIDNIIQTNNNEPNGEIISNEYINNNKNEEANLNINNEEIIENQQPAQQINEIQDGKIKEENNGEINEIKKKEKEKEKKEKEEKEKKEKEEKKIKEKKKKKKKRKMKMKRKKKERKRK